jgi:hypothetical protein
VNVWALGGARECVNHVRGRPGLWVPTSKVDYRGTFHRRNASDIPKERTKVLLRETV